MGKITYVYEEARVLFWLLNRRFAHSLMCVILAEEDQKLVSFLFILEWEKKKPHHTFMTVVNIFFILLMHSAMTKRPHGKGDGNNYFGYIFFSAMIIVLWTELSQGYRISWWWSSSSFSSSWRLLIFYSLCIKHAIIIHETWAKNFVSL